MNIAEWIERIGRQFEAAGLSYGHGTETARDEAAWLVLHQAGAALDGHFEDWGRNVAASDAREIERVADERCRSRAPLAYLLGSARFAGLTFEVGPQVLVPRSPVGELIEDGFRPWLADDREGSMLDLCTGSGCIAIASAVHMPFLKVDATDISDNALRVAAANVARHGVEDRVRLIRSNLFHSVPGRDYDLIVANPPYVPLDAASSLPAEYRAEPGLGLYSGVDGLDATLSILLDAPAFLGDDGILVCEVGESEERLAAALPRVPFLWLEFRRGGSGVFMLSRSELEAARADVQALIEER